MGEASSQNIRFLKGEEQNPRKWTKMEHWDPYKKFISGLIENGRTNNEIIRAMKDVKNVDMKDHQLKAVRREWGLSKRNLKPIETLYIHVTYHERGKEGKESAYRFTDTNPKEDVGQPQVHRVVSKSINATDSNIAKALLCSTVEVYTPGPELTAFPTGPLVSSPDLSPSDTLDPSFDPSFLCGMEGDYLGYSAPGSSQENQDPERYQDHGGSHQYTAKDALGEPSAIPQPPDETIELDEICGSIVQEILKISIQDEDQEVNLGIFPRLEAKPKPEYEDDMKKWIKDEVQMAKKIVEQVEHTNLQMNMLVYQRDAQSRILDQWSAITGENMRPYEVYLSILQGNDYHQQSQSVALALSRYLNWYAVLKLHDKYYDEMDKFTRRYFYKISFAMRLAHLPYLSQRYGTLHWFTIRSLYAFDKILRYVTNNVKELILVAEVLTLSLISMGMAQNWQGLRAFAHLLQLYEEDKSVDRSQMINVLSTYFGTQEIPPIVQQLDRMETLMILVLIYQGEGQCHDIPKAFAAQAELHDLLRPFIQNRSIPNRYTEVIFENVQQLGRGYVYLNQPAEALIHLQTALEVQNGLHQSFGAFYGNFTYGIPYMAQAYRQLGLYSASLKCFEIVLQWHTKYLGVRHKDTLGMIENVVVIMTERGLQFYAVPLSGIAERMREHERARIGEDSSTTTIQNNAQLEIRT